MPFKTRLLKKIEIQPYIDQMNPERVPTSAQIEDALARFILNKKATMRELNADEGICIGDAVELQTESALSKFNKPKIQVSAGRNMYDTALEEQLIGRYIGSRFTVVTHGVEVQVKILGAKRKCSVDRMITDTVVADLELPYATTVEELRQWIAESSNTVRFYVNGEMMPKLISEAEFTPVAQEDIDLKHRQYVEQMRKTCGITAEEEKSMSEAALKARLDGETSLDAYVKRWWDDEKQTETDLKTDLILMDVLGVTPGSDDDPAMDSMKHYELFERFLAFISNEVKRRRGDA